MKDAALRWLAAFCCVCSGLQASNVIAQVQAPGAVEASQSRVTSMDTSASAARASFSGSSSDAEISRLQQELRDVQSRERGLRIRSAELLAVARAEPPVFTLQGTQGISAHARELEEEAQAAERQATEAASTAQSIGAQIASLQQRAAQQRAEQQQQQQRTQQQKRIDSKKAKSSAKSTRGSATTSAEGQQAIDGSSPHTEHEPQAEHKHAHDGARGDGRPISLTTDRLPTAAKEPGMGAVSTPPVSANPSTTLAAESAKIDALVQGSAGVSAPPSGKVSETFTVYLRVSPDKLTALLANMKAEHPENATLQGKGVKLTPRMTATASGEGFDISPKEGQVQAVSSTDTTAWQWQVTPTKSGVKTVTIRLTGNLIVEGVDTPRTFFLDDEHIQVAISPGGFLEQYWQWLATTVAIPIVGALWALFRKRVDNRGASRPSVLDELKARRRKRAAAV